MRGLQRHFGGLVCALFALSSCVNGVVGTGLKSTSTLNQGSLLDPVAVGGSSMSVNAVVVGTFTSPANPEHKGVLLSIGKQLELYSRDQGGVAGVASKISADPTFAAQIFTITVSDLALKIELPMGSLLVDKKLYNGIILNHGGRVSRVYSHFLPESAASVAQTSLDRITVYGGTVGGTVTGRIIHLPTSGGIGIPGAPTDTQGNELQSYYSDGAIAVSAHAGTLEDHHASLQNYITEVSKDMRWMNRISYSESSSDPVCSKPEYANQSFEELLMSASATYVISTKKLPDGSKKADEVRLCSYNLQGEFRCMTYCYALVTGPLIRSFCGDPNRIKYGCDETKKRLLAPILSGMSRAQLPSGIEANNDADGSGQVKVLPL